MGRQNLFPLLVFSIVLLTALTAILIINYEFGPFTFTTSQLVGRGDLALPSNLYDAYARPIDSLVPNAQPYLTVDPTYTTAGPNITVTVSNRDHVFAQYVYKKGYFSNTSGWNQFTFSNATIGGSNWIKDNASITVTVNGGTDKEYVIVYVCRRYAAASPLFCGPNFFGANAPDPAKKNWTIAYYDTPLPPSYTCTTQTQFCSPTETISLQAANKTAGTGTCPTGQSCYRCASGYVNNSGECFSTACQPKTQSQACGTNNCGTAPDGCGGSISCGTCGSNQACSTASGPGTCQSVCTPKTQAQACGTNNCGSASDGCGATINCGTCTGSQTCSVTTGAGTCTTISCSNPNAASGAIKCSGKQYQTCTDGSWTTPQTCPTGKVCNTDTTGVGACLPPTCVAPKICSATVVTGATQTTDTCVTGDCFACNTGLSMCGNACVNFQTDNNNCGACGTVCGSGKTCQSSSCASTCTGCAISGTCYANGAANPSNACQACDTSKTSSDWSNKADGTTCSSGACQAGSCTCVKKTQAQACGTNNCGSAPDGCGGTVSCGTCTSAQTCNGNPGTCQANCVPNQNACAGYNCGLASNGCSGQTSCGICATGQTCSGNPGTCQASQTPKLTIENDVLTTTTPSLAFNLCNRGQTTLTWPERATYAAIASQSNPAAASQSAHFTSTTPMPPGNCINVQFGSNAFSNIGVINKQDAIILTIDPDKNLLTTPLTKIYPATGTSCFGTCTTDPNQDSTCGGHGQAWCNPSVPTTGMTNSVYCDSGYQAILADKTCYYCGDDVSKSCPNTQANPYICQGVDSNAGSYDPQCPGACAEKKTGDKVTTPSAYCGQAGIACAPVYRYWQLDGVTYSPTSTYDTACCNAASDCVDGVPSCVATGTVEGSYVCNNGVWKLK